MKNLIALFASLLIFMMVGTAASLAQQQASDKEKDVVTVNSKQANDKTKSAVDKKTTMKHKRWHKKHHSKMHASAKAAVSTKKNHEKTEVKETTSHVSSGTKSNGSK